MCVVYTKRFANWAGGTVGAVLWGAFLFIVVGGSMALVGGVMRGGSSMEEYRPYKSVVDDVERQQVQIHW